MREITKRTACHFPLQFRRLLCSAPLAVTRAAPADRQRSATTSATTSETSSSATCIRRRVPQARVHRLRSTVPMARHTQWQGPILAKFQSLTDAQKKDLGAPYRQREEDLGRQRCLPAVRWRRTAFTGPGQSGLLRLGQDPRRLERQRRLRKASWVTRLLMSKHSPTALFKSTFEHGTITWKPGDAEATVSYELSCSRAAFADGRSAVSAEPS